MIVDTSVAIDAIADTGLRGEQARSAIAAIDSHEELCAPGHFPIELMSGLRAVAKRPGWALQESDVGLALAWVRNFGISIESTQWSDVHRAWELALGSIRYADAIFIAAAERRRTILLTSDSRLAKSGARVSCAIVTVEDFLGLPQP
ncbi:MAG: type II toxin-antitoxin system VapC family toxin [Angustibacter sp.]